MTSSYLLSSPDFARDYRECFKAKRGQFLTTIKYFSELWDAFQMLDEIWVREIQSIRNPGTSTRILPASLLLHAHGRYRIAGELAFSGCIADALSITRSGIEFAAHANRIHLNSELAKVWLHKDDGKMESDAFQKEFVHHKKDRLFQDLNDLHERWKLFSEWGNHSTVAI